MSELINKNKYLDFGGLSKYDALIKNFIATGNNELANAIAALDAKIGSLELEGSDDKNLSEIVSEIYSSIAEIVESQESVHASLEAADKDLSDRIQKIVDDLEFVTGSSSENDATLGEINATLKDVTSELNSVKSTIDEVSSAANEAKDAAEQAQSDASAAMSAIEVLNGEGEGSVKKIAEVAAADAVASVVAGADSDFDTLKEVAEWIASDKEGAAALQVSVSKNAEDIVKLEEKVDGDIKNLADHMTDASAALGEFEGRIEALEAFEETHEAIAESDIEGLFA
jgi:chromosome segregation ATPase